MTDSMRWTRPLRRVVRVALLLVAAGLLATETAAAQATPVLPPWRVPLPQRPHAVVTVGDQVLDVELALTEPQRELGLGYRNGLAPATGMLFVYPQPAYLTFWMKGMRFCLDIVWIENGEVTGAAQSVCPSPPGTPDQDLPVFRSNVPVRYVLEVPAGWLASHGLGPGSPVTISPLPVSSGS